MSIKTIMCVVGLKVGDHDLQSAINLCNENNVRLSILVLAIASPPPIGDYTSTISDIWLEEREREIHKLEKRTASVAKLVETAGISASVHSKYVEFASAIEEIGRCGRYSDLILIGSDALNSKTLKSKIIEGALFESTRPLLMIPTGHIPTLTPKRILVAWDSRPEAARAVREALDMLVAADEVHVTIVDPDTGSTMNGPEPGADIGAYLAHHGVKVTVDRLPSGGDEIANIIKQHAVDMAADLVVMGGYGHSRLRERVFGGVTKSIIDSPTVPILMAR